MKFLRSNPLSTSTPVDSDGLNCGSYFFARNDFSFSPVFSCVKVQKKADFVPFFPFAVCFLADITDFSSNHVSAF